MYYPAKQQFLKLAKKGNVIPVYKEILADLETPVSAFLKIQGDDYAYLLESVEGQEKIARYSFLGTRPAIIFRSKGRNISINVSGRIAGQVSRQFIAKDSPLEEIKNIMQSFKFVKLNSLPPFSGGLIGYIAYDFVRFFEDIPDKNPDELNLPDSVFVLADTLVIFDHLNHKIKIVTNVILDQKASLASQYDQATSRIESIQRLLNKKTALKEKRKSPKIKVYSNFTKQRFCGIVLKAKEYIKRGDIIQVVLSQRFKAKINSSEFDIYRNLRSLNPSPYMFFLKFKEASVIGSSPEMMVRCEDGTVEMRPIAGTRPRGDAEAEDRRLEKDLLSDRKERAEHLMLVDLARNDLGRVCGFGKIEVPEFMTIERYSHVMHIVSDVRGKLRPGNDIYDVLAATFPAGTVSGSPKIRAMEIIDELESIRRGPYAGCVGYISFSGNLDTAITIRTIVVKDKTAYIQAGAGIVADSKPAKEYQETINKARAQLEAITR